MATKAEKTAEKAALIAECINAGINLKGNESPKKLKALLAKNSAPAANVGAAPKVGGAKRPANPSDKYLEMERIIENYKVSNPAKYELKKDELAAKLAALA